jgi:predicted hydrocarbon binding protein
VVNYYERGYLMTAENDTNNQGSAKEPMPTDDLNAKIGVLIRREVEARILSPVIEALGESFGRDQVLSVVQSTIVKIAREQGEDLSKLMGDNSLQHFSETLQFWTRDDALEIKVIEETEEVLSFNVARCRYAELYDSLGIRDIGTIFSCARDFALIEGFNPDVSLTRTQTIMEGAPFCDFRYRLMH